VVNGRIALPAKTLRWAQGCLLEIVPHFDNTDASKRQEPSKSEEVCLRMRVRSFPNCEHDLRIQGQIRRPSNQKPDWP
jgi:hypothetical protein